MMASKCPESSTLSKMKSKHVRKSLCLEIKFNIIKWHEVGEGANSITRVLNLAQSHMSTVVKKAGENATSFMAKTNTKHREPIIEMEKLLKLYIDDQSRHHMALSTALVMTKPLSLYEDLQNKGYAVKEWNQFTASSLPIY